MTNKPPMRIQEQLDLATQEDRERENIKTARQLFLDLSTVGVLHQITELCAGSNNGMFVPDANQKAKDEMDVLKRFLCKERGRKISQSDINMAKLLQVLLVPYKGTAQDRSWAQINMQKDLLLAFVKAVRRKKQDTSQVQKPRVVARQTGNRLQ